MIAHVTSANISYWNWYHRSLLSQTALGVPIRSRVCRGAIGGVFSSVY